VEAWSASVVKLGFSSAYSLDNAISQVSKSWALCFRLLYHVDIQQDMDIVRIVLA
jgi:hypothetical protein